MPCLVIINGKVIKFSYSNDLKVAHNAWNLIHYNLCGSLFSGFDILNEVNFYFVHSYHFIVVHGISIASELNYGITFISLLWKNKVFGVQYDHEKRHQFRLNLKVKFLNVSIFSLELFQSFY